MQMWHDLVAQLRASYSSAVLKAVKADNFCNCCKRLRSTDANTLIYNILRAFARLGSRGYSQTPQEKNVLEFTFL